jgi:hypothetical protein
VNSRMPIQPLTSIRCSFAVGTVENWNKLPEEVKTSRNGEEFKNKLKKLKRSHRRDDWVKVMDNAEN